MRFAALAISIVVTLAFAEAALRVRQYVKYGSAGTALYEMKYDPASQLAIPKPNQVTRTIRIDSRGFRNPEIRMPKPAGTIRLAFLGASTTFCAEASSNEATWPHLVWKTLQASWPDVRFDYINAGVPGYIVASSLRNLEYRVQPLGPDVIVIYEGVNDLSRDTRALALKEGIQRGSVDDESGLGRWLLTWSLVEKNLRLAARQRSAGQADARRLTFDSATLARGFHGRLEELARKSSAAAPVVALATFSQKVRPDQTPATQLHNANTHLYYMPYMGIDGILKGFDEYNRTIRAVAAETGAALIGGENEIPGDDRYFNDSVHFKDAGCVLMAKRVVDGLMKSEAFRRLIDERRPNTVPPLSAGRVD